MVAFDVAVTDDMMFEFDENFILTINVISLAAGITCPGQATVTIVDNEILAGTKFYSIVIF